MSATSLVGDHAFPGVATLTERPVKRRSRFIVPQLKNRNIRIRLATSVAEIEFANRLVCTNYLESGYWDTDEPFHKNPHMYSPCRVVFVAEDQGQVIGTASIVKDSDMGLPADKFQPQTMKRLRDTAGRMAEVSALAVCETCDEGSALVLFLFKYIYQYSFYYAGVDSLVVVPTTQHVSFYKRVCGFHELSGEGCYDYVKPEIHAQLLVADLLQAHQFFYERYESANGRPNFYRFLLVDDDQNLQFPDGRFVCRSREIDWLAQARKQRMPLAG